MSHNNEPFCEVVPHSPWTGAARRLGRPVHFKQIVIATVALVMTLLFFFSVNYQTKDPIETNYHTPENTDPPPALGKENLVFGQHGHLIITTTSTTDYPTTTVLAPETTTTEYPQTTSIPPSDVHLEQPSEAVVFSLLMYSADSANEGAILLKSILMYTSSPVEFHIICDEGAETYLRKRLELVARPTHDVLVRFYRLTYDDMQRRLQREGAVVSDHSAGVPGLMKLFIHEILPPSVKKAIYIDTDAFFISDPTLLWDHFLHLNASTAIAMPTHPQMEDAEWHGASKICSCVMLLNLERLRELRVMDSAVYRADTSGAFPPALSPPAFTAMFGPPGAESGHYEGVKLGDQGYWWAIVSYYPEIFEHLHYDWEVSSCLIQMYWTSLGHDDRTEEEDRAKQNHLLNTPHYGDTIMPKLLHFNCLDGVKNYYDWPGWEDPTDYLARAWAPAVKYHVGYKWLWLNQRREAARMTMETVEHVIFADEYFAMGQQ